jgi:hypothetical protein
MGRKPRIEGSAEEKRQIVQEGSNQERKRLGVMEQRQWRLAAAGGKPMQHGLLDGDSRETFLRCSHQVTRR